MKTFIMTLWMLWISVPCFVTYWIMHMRAVSNVNNVFIFTSYAHFKMIKIIWKMKNSTIEKEVVQGSSKPDRFAHGFGMQNIEALRRNIMENFYVKWMINMESLLQRCPF